MVFVKGETPAKHREGCGCLRCDRTQKPHNYIGLKAICKNCGNEFDTYPSAIKVGRGKYCSRECAKVVLFKEGNSGYWLGKKRPDLINTGAFKTMYKKGRIPSPEEKEIAINTLRPYFSDQTGEKNHQWNGGRKIDSKGYIRILSGKTKSGHTRYKAEHRIVVEQFLGRELTQEEVVHHVDGDKQNNKIENLRLMSKQEHDFLHAEMRRRKN